MIYRPSRNVEFDLPIVSKTESVKIPKSSQVFTATEGYIQPTAETAFLLMLWAMRRGKEVNLDPYMQAVV